jgi:manganese-dependent ADP-ribose/CDP-alcohol diphosphatase
MFRNYFFKLFIIIFLEMGSSAVNYSQTRDIGSKKENPGLPILKIGLIADPQYCDCNSAGNRYYRESLKRIPEAIDTFNKAQVDFVMNLGDMIDKFENSYDSVIKFYNKLHMPFYNLLGNHEFEGVSDKYKLGILNKYRMPDFYYDFKYGNWRFIILDGTELGKYSSFLHSDLEEEGEILRKSVKGNVNDLPWNGGISHRQQLWLQNRLIDALKNNENVIIFCHFPLFPESIDLSLWNYNEIIDILEKYPNVVAYISGHYHEGSYGSKNGIHYLTQKAMVDTPDKNSYAILEIYSNDIRIRGFGDIPDKILLYSDIKNH